MRELEKIKKEREEESKRMKEMEQKLAEEKEKEFVTSNPLLNEKQDFNIRKR